MVASAAFLIAGVTLVTDWESIDLNRTPQTEESVEAEPRTVTEFTLLPNTSVYDSLTSSGFTPQEVHDVVKAASPFLDLSRVRAGTRYEVYGTAESGGVSGLRFIVSPTRSLEITRQGTEAPWVAEEIQEAVEIRHANFSGVVTSSLWESATEAGMDPTLIAELTEIFAWQVDFAREVQLGDRWRLTVEQKFVKGKPVKWGKITAAEYQNTGNLHSAVLFRKEDQEVGYFSPDGSNLRQMFLKSPIRFGRISSRFSRKRFHPVLMRFRPHLGVDYAAPSGTPIRAVGDGVVSVAGYRGGGGNTIKIRHNSVYQTAYLHLRAFARGIRAGARVRQGQIIGYVGSTGLSTGPHLHFEFYENGRFVDPLGKRFPAAEPIAASDLPEFKVLAAQALATLPEWSKPESIVTRRERLEDAPVAD